MRIPLRALAMFAVAAMFAIPAVANPFPRSEPIRAPIVEVGAMDTNGVNCAILRGTPFVCIKNQASAPVTAVQVVNVGSAFAPNSWIDMGYFGGAIQPGGTTVVKFGTYGSGCQKLLFVRLANQSTHPFNVDVCHAASILVSGW